MKSQLKQLLSESAIYGLSSILPKLIGLVLIPFYTKVLIPADYGTMNLINAFLSLVLVFSLFSMDNSATRWFYDSEVEEEQKKIISSWFWFHLSVTIVLSLLLFLFADLIMGKFLRIEDQSLYYIAVAGFFMKSMPAVTVNWFRMLRMPKQTVAYSLFHSLLEIGLTVYFVLSLKLGVYGIFLGALIGSTVKTLVGLFLMRKWIIPKLFRSSLIRHMFVFALPMIPTSIALWLYNTSSSFFIDYFHGKTDLGLFQIGLSLAGGIVILIYAFKMAFPPFAFSIYKQKHAKQLFSYVLHLYSFVCILSALLIALFSKEILILFTVEAYYGAFVVAGILVFYNILYGYGTIVGLGSQIVKNNKPHASSIFLGSGITLALYFLLVPRFGKEGAAASMLLGSLIIPIYLYIKSQKSWPIPYKPQVTIYMFLYALALFVWSINLSEMETLWFVGIRFAMLISFVLVALILFRVFDLEFYNKLLSFVKKGKLNSIFKS